MSQQAQNVMRRKLVIIGDGACGKTSLLSVFTLGYFPTVSPPYPTATVRMLTLYIALREATILSPILPLMDINTAPF
jgi:GTPase SAR1 family protein